MDDHQNNPEIEDNKERQKGTNKLKEAKYIVPPGLANKIREFGSMHTRRKWR